MVLSPGGVPVNMQFTLEPTNTVLRIKPANLLSLLANKFYKLIDLLAFRLTPNLSSCYSA